MHEKPVLVVGAGFAGAVMAERLSSAGKQVVVVESRPHIAGNAYDELDEFGVLIHRYGPHIFHTSSDEVFAYLSRFTDWRPYEHRVLASIDVGEVPLPVNLTTMEMIFGRAFDEESARSFIQSKTIKLERVLTSKDLVLSRVGPEIYEKIFLNYTRKQWGLDPGQLDATVAGRLPVRFDRDDRYFTDTHQAMPKRGYTAMFANILDHPNIRVELCTDYRDVSKRSFSHVVFTGPIDKYFDYAFGALPYRSLQFQFTHHGETKYAQSVGTVNFPNDYEYTRRTEFKHLTGQETEGTTTCVEVPTDCGDPYYPVPSPSAKALYDQYAALAREVRDCVTFTGRLATYKYYNMDQVVAQALKEVLRWE
jgi:UDP-galactopyranose mutase